MQKGTHSRTDSYSGFGDASPTKMYEKTQLEVLLRANGVTDVVAMGLATDFCVSFSCKDSAACGFRTYCVIDGSRHIAPDSLATELRAMRHAGVAVVRSTDVAGLLAAPTRAELSARLAEVDARETAAAAAAAASVADK